MSSLKQTLIGWKEYDQQEFNIEVKTLDGILKEYSIGEQVNNFYRNFHNANIQQEEVNVIFLLFSLTFSKLYITAPSVHKLYQELYKVFICDESGIQAFAVYMKKTPEQKSFSFDAYICQTLLYINEHEKISLDDDLHVLCKKVKNLKAPAHFYLLEEVIMKDYSEKYGKEFVKNVYSERELGLLCEIMNDIYFLLTWSRSRTEKVINYTIGMMCMMGVKNHNLDFMLVIKIVEYVEFLKKNYKNVITVHLTDLYEPTLNSIVHFTEEGEVVTFLELSIYEKVQALSVIAQDCDIWNIILNPKNNFVNMIAVWKEFKIYETMIHRFAKFFCIFEYHVENSGNSQIIKKRYDQFIEAFSVPKKELNADYIYFESLVEKFKNELSENEKKQPPLYMVGALTLHQKTLV